VAVITAVAEMPTMEETNITSGAGSRSVLTTAASASPVIMRLDVMAQNEVAGLPKGKWQRPPVMMGRCS